MKRDESRPRRSSRSRSSKPSTSLDRGWAGKGPRARGRRVSRGDARQQMTDTDRELVDQVVEHRVATTQQLAALLGMPDRTVRYRMEKLRRLGMVRRATPPVVKGKAADHWYPTKNADSWAKGTPVPRGGERQAPGTSFLVHSAAITGFYVALLRLGQAGWTPLAWERESVAKEHFRARDRERKIVPDAFIVLRAGDAEYRAFVEIDMGSMSMVRLSQKLAGYAAYYHEQAWKERHPFPPILLVLTTSQARVESIINRFEDHLTRRGRYRDEYLAFDADHWEPVIGACEFARDPETALGESVWSGSGGIDGLTLADLLDPPWQRWSDEQAAARAEHERRRREKERLRRDPVARRAHLQQHVYSGELERPIESLDGQEAEAMFRLIRGSGPMSAEERAAFAFIDRRLPGPDDKPYERKHPEPPTEDERAAIKALVDYYIGCRRRLLAAFYARYPDSPHVLRAVRQLEAGRLLTSTDEEFLDQHIRNDLATLKRTYGRKLDYISWRNKKIDELRVQTPAVRRLIFDREAAATELDRRHLRYCSRCEQLAIPSAIDSNYLGDVTCAFCYHKPDTTLDDAHRQRLIRPDGNGFWEVCHRPVPAWASSEVGLTILGPALTPDEEEDE
jgi:DNA-binding Lrp family transcriptional regulator